MHGLSGYGKEFIPLLYYAFFLEFWRKTIGILKFYNFFAIFLNEFLNLHNKMLYCMAKYLPKSCVNARKPLILKDFLKKIRIDFHWKNCIIKINHLGKVMQWKGTYRLL